MNSFIMYNAAIFSGFTVYSRLNFIYDVVSLFFCFYLLLFKYNRFSSFSHILVLTTYCTVRNPGLGLQWIFLIKLSIRSNNLACLSKK